MVVIIDKKFREKIKSSINKQCPLCGRDIFVSDDIVYSKHKQGETIVHLNCYNKLLRKRGKIR